jgi:NDP-sugar pyrophosphorylase family protein
MKVVIPMSGMSSRFSAAGYTTPKFLIEVDGKTIIEHIIDLFPKDSEFIFVVNDIHSATTDIQQRLTDLVENKNICSISSHKLGPVHTVSQIFDLIEDDEQVIVNYCDFSMYWDYNKFENFVNTTECDGCVVCYTGFHPHMLGSDNYAFCKVNGENKILEIREKQPFTNDKMSEFASTGTYYFRKGSYVKKYFRDLIDRDININGEYYVSLIYNLMNDDNLNSLVYEVPHMLQWGTPSDLDFYKKWSSYNVKTLFERLDAVLVDAVTILPMAGMGSRFSENGYTTPKPFITINGKRMVDQAVRCLPRTDKVIYGCLKDHEELATLDGEIVWIDQVLQGQACTCEKILENVNDESAILVSACDNGVFYDPYEFSDLVNDESNDIIVWSYTKNYASKYNPNMYSWLDIDNQNNIKKVNVKQFTGENPLDGNAIVGTMFFRNKSKFLEPLKKLYENNITTNGEYYVDNLINTAIELGYKVKNFTVDEYICWGTPNDLKTYEYWQRFFNKVDWHPYSYEQDYFTN